MAGYSWSDPNPSGATAALLGNAAHINEPNIGVLVHAILQMRARNEELKQQQLNSMLAGIAKGAGEMNTMQQQGNANDAANAAIYASQYPNDVYGGLQNPDVVPDYGGTRALQALEAARKVSPWEFESPQQKQMDAAKLDAMQALAEQRRGGGDDNPSTYTDPVTGQRFLVGPTGGLHPLGTSANATKGEIKQLSDYLKGYGLTQEEFGKAANMGDEVFNGQNPQFTIGGEPVDADTMRQIRDRAKRYMQLSGGAGQAAQQQPAPEASGGQPVNIKSDDDYYNLPSGAYFVGPDGQLRQKP